MTLRMPTRADVHAHFEEHSTVDHTRETPRKQSNELQALTNQGGRSSALYECPYLDRITYFRLDKFDASHPPDTHELTERRIYDDAVRHFHTMAAGHSRYDVLEMMLPVENSRMAFYRRNRTIPNGSAIESIAALEKVIKDANGREPEIQPTALGINELGIDALDNVTNRPLKLTTAHEFPVESLLRNLSEKHGRLTVAHLDQYKTDGTPIENEFADAHAFDFSPPPTYQMSAQA
jgi:hypothetical protein